EVLDGLGLVKEAFGGWREYVKAFNGRDGSRREFTIFREPKAETLQILNRLILRRLSGLPPFCGPVAVRVGSIVPDVSSGRRRLCGVGPRTHLPELRRCPIPQRAVRPLVVVLPLPPLRQHPRLQQAAELLRVEQLVTHLAVERLRIAV